MRKTFMFFSVMLVALLAPFGMQAAKVYYNNPDGWTAVHAHFYNETTDFTTWPGTALTVSDGLWSVDIPDGATKVVFNNNGQGSQYPTSGGLAITSGQSMLLNGTTWVVYYDAGTVYFDNTADNWTQPYAYYWGLTTSSDFPGPAMTQVEGEAKMWKIDIPAGTYGIVFSDGSNNDNNKSADLVPIPGHKYQKSGDKGVYVAAGPAPEAFDVYFDNRVANWATPYIHYWGGTTESTYPGVAMTKVDGKETIYKYTVAGGTTGILFNAGDGDATKTSNFTAAADHVYTQDGDQGEYASYNPSIEMPSALYILGTVGKTSWDTNSGIAMTKDGNTFKAEGVTLNASVAGGDKGYFTFVTTLGANWDAVNAGDRYGAAGNADLQITAGTPVSVAKYAANVSAAAAKSYILAPGDYDITINFETMTMTAVAAGTPIVANGAFIIPDVTIHPNGNATVEIQLNADAAMTAAQFYIEVPSFVTMGTPTLSAVMADHTLQSSVQDGKTLITIRSESNAAFARNNAELLYLPITAADGTLGDHEIKITGIRLTTASVPRQEVTAEDVTGKLTVEATAASISLDKSQVALQVGETATITATVEPEGVYGDVVWATDNASVATVANGVVTAVAKGTATITATYGSASATCVVTVGKNAQTITWDQTFTDPIGIGEDEGVELTATASSGLAIEYAITAGNSFAHITDGKLIGDQPGVVTVQARQAGNDSYAPAEPVSKTITVWLGYEMGDANGDGAVTVADATTVLNYIHGLNPDPFNAAASDLDGNGEITITDVVLITDIILDQARNASTSVRANVSAIEKEQFNVVASDYSLRISFSNMENYIATQFDLTLPEGNTVKSATVAGSNHTISFRERDGIYRMVVLSVDNDNFASNGYIDLTLRQAICGELVLDNALINSTSGDNIVEDAAKGYTTVISGVEGIMAQDGECTVYTVDGVRVYQGAAAGFQAQPGLYLIRTAGKVQKVIVR